MELDNFFIQQDKFNKELVIDSNLNDYKVATRMYLALQVKISELADETKCFIYWNDSNKSRVSKQLVLEKYIDCLKQILTIGLNKNYTCLKKLIVKPNDYCLSDQFLTLLIDVNDLIISPSIDHYKTLFEDFISLGISLGFSINQIEEIFFKNDFCKIAL